MAPHCWRWRCRCTPISAQDARTLIELAKGDLARGDGIAAEFRLRKALAAGAPREAVAARMGEALIAQDQRAKARTWLAPGRFAAGEATHGYRMLGLLERLDGNLPAAGKAYDRALAIEVRNPALWVDIGRLRYAGGEQLQAIEAADYALQLDPANVRALEFRGQLVRDQFGLAGSLAWFEAALAQAPDDLSVLGEYATTLGELGRAKDMLAATRAMLERDPKNAKALYLQAVLAARAGDAGLARSLLAKTGHKLDAMPAKMLLEGVLELRQGNNLLAIEALERLVQRQPANERAQALLAAAYYAQGNYKVVARRFGPVAREDTASPYLMTLVARAHEIIGERDAAVPLLERAFRTDDRPFAPVSAGTEVGTLIAEHRFAEAAALAERRRAANPGSYATQSDGGDAQLALGNAGAAIERYKLAARVRLPESLVLRMTGALARSGEDAAAGRLVEGYLTQSPASRGVLREAAGFAVRRGDTARAVRLLDTLRGSGGGSDARLLADLALAQLRNGDAATAEATAREAYRLLPASAFTARAWELALAALKQRPDDAKSAARQGASARRRVAPRHSRPCPAIADESDPMVPSSAPPTPPPAPTRSYLWWPGEGVGATEIRPFANFETLRGAWPGYLMGSSWSSWPASDRHRSAA